MWDSTGPKGGLGAKFQRALVSEIVGINAIPGTRSSSRIDPVTTGKIDYPLYKAAAREEMWTDEQSQALTENGKPVRVGKKEKAGKPSAVVIGNIAPSIDSVAGGVTIDEARHTVVLSLASLRRLGFISGAEAARTVLAALGLLAVFAADNRGHDLRSRCLLVSKKDCALKLEAVARDGSTTPLNLDLDGAIELYNEAVSKLPETLKFENAPGVALAELTPSAKLAGLVRNSRELGVADTEDGDA